MQHNADDVFNRAFDSKFFSSHDIRNPRSVAKALCDLHYASHSDKAFPEEVRLAWLALYDVAGRELLGKLMETGAWREFVPEVSGPSDSLLSNVVWTNGDKSVTARLVYTYDEPRDIRFTIDAAGADMGVE
jgi:hypothetical protein